MPRDGSGGAPAPRSLSLLLRERRLKKLAAHSHKAVATRRRVTALRLAEAEHLLAAIIDGGDVLADVTLPPHGLDGPEPGVVLLVTMTKHHFHQLCEIGAEREDLEDTHDAEPDQDDEPTADLEPTLVAVTGHNTGAERLGDWEALGDVVARVRDRVLRRRALARNATPA